MITVDRAIRTRWCKNCHQEIRPGNHHIRYNTNTSDHSFMNLCQECTHRMVARLDKLNATQEE